MSDVGVVEIVSKVSLYLGVATLGVAAGTTIGLEAIQPVCLQSGGSIGQAGPVAGGPTGPCWASARQLQTIANASGYSCAALLLVGGVLDQFPEAARSIFESGTEGAS